MNTLKKRSSWASSFLAGFVGWNAVVFVGTLAFGFIEPIPVLLLLAFCMAILQISMLRVLFSVLYMHKSVFIGIIWGLFSGIGLYFAAKLFFTDLELHQLPWLIIFGFTGAAEGAFLSYYAIDDRKIQEAITGKISPDIYGRDAHWYEPFGFGAFAFLIAFLPSLNITVITFAAIIGAMNGIISAAVSHFSPDKYKKSIFTLALLVIVLGGLQGLVAGLLFRNFADVLPMHFLVHGALGGILTYLITFIRGRKLAEIENQ